MAEQQKWQWQHPGTAWKGVSLYHITLTIPSRKPHLGTLVIPDGDPTKAWVKRTALGNALLDCLVGIPRHHPEVQVLHFCLMPDHLHAVLYVRRTMDKGIGSLVRGFWQASKKLGRAFSVALSIEKASMLPNGIRGNCQEGASQAGVGQEGSEPLSPRGGIQEGASQPGVGQEESEQPSPRGGIQEGASQPGVGQEVSEPPSPKGGVQEGSEAQGGLKGETMALENLSSVLRKQMGDDVYYQQEAIFTEMPFIRPMGRRTQLQNTIRYIDMNPQRLATKRQKPGFFRVQKDITIGGRNYDGVGNVTLLMSDRFEVVHVRHAMVKMAEQGDNTPLRNYMNGCVLAARKGAVMVSPFISQQEKQVMAVLLREGLPFVLLTDNGFRDYYKPTDSLFDACAAGRVLILSPWKYDAGKRHISRKDCVALNTMAEEITRI